MDPVVTVLVPGFLGGLVIAALCVLWQRRRPSAPRLASPSYRSEPLSINAINMASIRVAGLGGLGLVAMAAAVALDVPRIGQSVAIGFVLGVATAAVLIFRRRRSGPMPSSGRGLGANTVLSIDGPRDVVNHRSSEDPGIADVQFAPGS